MFRLQVEDAQWARVPRASISPDWQEGGGTMQPLLDPRPTPLPACAGDPAPATDAGLSSDDPRDVREASASGALLSAQDLQFSVGAPHLPLIHGSIRLFRDAGVPIAAAIGKSRTLCVVAVPARISVNEFVHFVGPYAAHIEHMRLVRDEVAGVGRYMVLIRFADQDAADGFYRGFNGKHFTSFEPEHCHVVYVAQVQLKPRARGTAAAAAAAATAPTIASSTEAAAAPTAALVTAGASELAPDGGWQVMDEHLLPTDPLYAPATGSPHATPPAAASVAPALHAAHPVSARDGDAHVSAGAPVPPALPARCSRSTCSVASSSAASASSSPSASRDAHAAAAAAVGNAGSIALVSGCGAACRDAGRCVCAAVEVPSCPVCLERLDASASGMLTTMCNHTFHASCLSRWDDNTCPVCRYCIAAEEEDDAAVCCETCGERDNLWMCLVCGHVGCGRFTNEHALAHYRSTLHTYSMELTTQRVWDYAGDGYVHRLIQNRADGKLVELPDPAHASANGTRSWHPPDTDVVHGSHATAACASVDDKLDGALMEFTMLLTHQLEAQRLHYEHMLAAVISLIPRDAVNERRIADDIVASRGEVLHSQVYDTPTAGGASSSGGGKASATAAAAATAAATAVTTAAAATAAAAATSSPAHSVAHHTAAATASAPTDVACASCLRLQRRVEDVEARASAREAEVRSITEQLRQVGAKAAAQAEELAFVRDLNDTLILGKKQREESMQQLVAQHARQEAALKGRIAELEEQVGDLMMFLDTQSKVAAADAETQAALASGRIVLQHSAGAGAAGTSTRHKHAVKRAVKPSGAGTSTGAGASTGAGGGAAAASGAVDDGFASIGVSSKTKSAARR